MEFRLRGSAGRCGSIRTALRTLCGACVCVCVELSVLYEVKRKVNVETTHSRPSICVTVSFTIQMLFDNVTSQEYVCKPTRYIENKV